MDYEDRINKVKSDSSIGEIDELPKLPHGSIQVANGFSSEIDESIKDPVLGRLKLIDDRLDKIEQETLKPKTKQYIYEVFLVILGSIVTLVVQVIYEAFIR